MNHLACRPVSSSLCFAAFLALVFLASPVHSRSLADIVASNKVIVGVTQDVPLWGYRDTRSGVISGIEVDLAQSLADRLGVMLETVGMSNGERIDAIKSGRVDVLIANLSDTAERGDQVTLVKPHYYSSGTNLLSRKIDKFRDWTQLKNRKICGSRSAFYNRQLTVKYGVDIIALHSRDWAIRAFLDGRCRALISNDVVITTLLKNPGWAELYEMPLPTIYPIPWAVAIAKDEAGGALEKAVSAAIIGWHRDGELLRLERKWNIPGSGFVRTLNVIWNKRKPDGSWYCGTVLNASTPQECL